jgi:hypothetical protein
LAYPFGHPAHFLFVDAIGRRGDGASSGDGQRRAGKDFSVASILRYGSDFACLSRRYER